MRPESISAFRERTRDAALKHIAEALTVGGPTVIRAVNGSAANEPDAVSIANNAQIREQWLSADFGEVRHETVRTRGSIRLFKVREVSFSCALNLADFFGDPWPTITQQAQDLIQTFPLLADRNTVKTLLRSHEEIGNLHALLRWRAKVGSDGCAGVSLREIPVIELGSKWVERNYGLVFTAFNRMGWANPDETGAAERIGFFSPENAEVHVRMSDDDALMANLWKRFSVPASLFAASPGGLSKIIIIENKATFLSFPMCPGLLVLWGGGKAAVSWTRTLSWLCECEMFYWGDCDADGYLILDRIREHLPHVRSVMMSEDEAGKYISHALTVSESESRDYAMKRLTKGEASLCQRLIKDKLRIEQESLPLNDAADKLSL